MTNDSVNIPADGEADVPSPCVGTCRLHEADRRCIGCERTLDEISRWSHMDSEERRAVLECLPARQAARRGVPRAS